MDYDKYVLNGGGCLSIIKHSDSTVKKTVLAHDPGKSTKKSSWLWGPGFSQPFSRTVHCEYLGGVVFLDRPYDLPQFFPTEACTTSIQLSWKAPVELEGAQSPL